LQVQQRDRMQFTSPRSSVLAESDGVSPSAPPRTHVRHHPRRTEFESEHPKPSLVPPPQQPVTGAVEFDPSFSLSALDEILNQLESASPTQLRRAEPLEPEDDMMAESMSVESFKKRRSADLSLLSSIDNVWQCDPMAAHVSVVAANEAAAKAARAAAKAARRQAELEAQTVAAAKAAEQAQQYANAAALDATNKLADEALIAKYANI